MPGLLVKLNICTTFKLLFSVSAFALIPLEIVAAKTTSNPKLQLGLAEIAEQARLNGAEVAELADRPILQVNRQGILVEVWLNRMPADIESRLSAAGLSVAGSYTEQQVVTGRVALQQLEQLTALPEVDVVVPVMKPVLNVGSAENQADESMRADIARSLFSTDGSGVTVGVLSDSFNDTIGGVIAGAGCDRILTASDSQTSADLPNQVVLLDNGGGGGTDEGAGMAELIHDVAPGAELSFHTAFNGEADFADAITELVNCGADVVVDDVIYFAEPMFQDGFVAQAAQQAHDAGVPYFSSAGNNGTNGVNEVFTDVAPGTDDQQFDPNVSGNDFHQFDGGDEFATVTIPDNCQVRFVLQWNQPYSGSLGPGPNTDLDIYACTAKDPATCNTFSINQQGNCDGSRSGNPVEIMPVLNTSGSSQNYHIAVDHFCGPDGADVTEAIEFRIVTYESCGAAVTYEANVFDQPQIYGHAAAEGVNGTAAVFYGEVDFDGDVDAPPGQINVEPFSSLGGDLPFYFDGDGTPLAGGVQTRFKPDITAPDGGNTSFFGNDIGFDADNDPNFFGTSAAAPNAAAVAALMLSSSNALPSNAVRQVMQASAVDIESNGVDPLSGAGLVEAVFAVQTVTDQGTSCIPVLGLSEQTITGSTYFRACDEIEVGNNFNVTSGGQLQLETGSGSVILAPGTRIESGGSLRVSRNISIN